LPEQPEPQRDVLPIPDPQHVGVTTYDAKDPDTMAVGVALSPVPIIAIVLMLGTPRARSNGPALQSRKRHLDRRGNRSSRRLHPAWLAQHPCPSGDLLCAERAGRDDPRRPKGLDGHQQRNDHDRVVLVLGGKLLGDGIAGLSLRLVRN
jgi:hypothetical protein